MKKRLFKIREQKLYFVMVPHKNTIMSAFIWWARNKNRQCHSFCPTCEFYFRCQEDIALMEVLGDKND